MKPSIGRIVLFKLAYDSLWGDTGEMVPGIISKVLDLETEHVALTLFPGSAALSNLPVVKCHSGDGLGQWSWPVIVK